MEAAIDTLVLSYNPQCHAFLQLLHSLLSQQLLCVASEQITSRQELFATIAMNVHNMFDGKQINLIPDSSSNQPYSA